MGDFCPLIHSLCPPHLATVTFVARATFFFSPKFKPHYFIICIKFFRCSHVLWINLYHFPQSHMVWQLFFSQLYITTLLFGSCCICLLSGPQMLPSTVPLLCNDCQFNCHLLRPFLPAIDWLCVYLYNYVIHACLPPLVPQHCVGGPVYVWLQLCLQYLARCWCHEYLWKGTCRKEKRSLCISSRESEVQASSLREAGCWPERWLGTSWRMEKHREWVLASWRLCFW